MEDLKLEATFARLFASGVPASDKEIGRHLDLTSDKVNVSVMHLLVSNLQVEPSVQLNCFDNAICAGGLGFESRVRQIRISVTSAETFLRSCVA